MGSLCEIAKHLITFSSKWNRALLFTTRYFSATEVRSEAKDVLKEVPADDVKEASSDDNDDEEEKDTGDAEETPADDLKEEAGDEKEEQPEDEESEENPAEESEVEESEDPEGILKYISFSSRTLLSLHKSPSDLK